MDMVSFLSKLINTPKKETLKKMVRDEHDFAVTVVITGITAMTLAEFDEYWN